MSEVLHAGEEAVVTFIDYTAAFDSLSHRFLDEALAEANVSPKVRRIIQAIYSSASGVVRIREASGKTCSLGHFQSIEVPYRETFIALQALLSGWTAFSEGMMFTVKVSAGLIQSQN